MIARVLLTASLTACQGESFAERPIANLEIPLVPLLCSDEADIKARPKVLVGAGEIDGENIVRLGHIPGGWLKGGAKLTNAINYYAIQSLPAGRVHKIRAAGSEGEHRYQVEFDVRELQAGSITGSVKIVEDGVSHAGACIPAFDPSEEEAK